MRNKILALPQSLKRKSLRALHSFFVQNYEGMIFLVIDLILFFKMHDIGIARSLAQRARIQYPFHPGLKKVEEDLLNKFNDSSFVDDESLHLNIFIRDTYIRLYKSGHSISQIDTLLGRGQCNSSNWSDKFSNFNWARLDRYLDSYAVAESTVIKGGQGPLLKNEDSLLKKIEQCIDRQKGFSFIRLGDGEGTLLGSNFQNGNNVDMKNMLRTWWGNEDIDVELLKKMQQSLQKAVDSADVVGIPDLAHQLSDFSTEGNRFSRAYKKLNELIVQNLDKSFLSAYANHTLFNNGSLDKVIKDLRLDLCLISGHKETSLRSCFREKYSVEIDVFIQIPSEHRFIDKFGYANDEIHYPTVYNRVCSQLEIMDLKGKLFLVGAGVLGKYYCHLIKQGGGIALDLGSVFDYMLGHETRKFFHIKEDKITQ